MANSDTIKLLQECDSGSKMAVASIDEVFDKIKDEQLLNLLKDSKKHHEKLGNDLHSMLNRLGADDKEPSAIAKGMSWMKTNVKIGMDSSDTTIATLITDGCDMGIKSLCKYLNQYQAADQEAKKIATDLIDIEEKLRKRLQEYL